MSKFFERYWMLWEEMKAKDNKLTREKFADRLGVSSGQSNEMCIRDRVAEVMMTKYDIIY